MMDLSSLFGQIDIYLFDQLLHGRIGPEMTVLAPQLPASALWPIL
jgi:hypothetical protein